MIGYDLTYGKNSLKGRPISQAEVRSEEKIRETKNRAVSSGSIENPSVVAPVFGARWSEC